MAERRRSTRRRRGVPALGGGRGGGRLAEGAGREEKRTLSRGRALSIPRLLCGRGQASLCARCRQLASGGSRACAPPSWHRAALVSRAQRGGADPPCPLSLPRCLVPSTVPATGKCKQEPAFPASNRRKRKKPVHPARVGVGPTQGHERWPPLSLPHRQAPESPRWTPGERWPPLPQCP